MHRLNKNGFTIVELIVVIGMLGLLFSVAVPMIDMNHYNLLTAGKALRDNIKAVKYETMTEGTYVRILFDKYSYRVMEGSKVKNKVLMNNGIKIVQNFKDSTVTFNYNGAPLTGGGTVSILDEKTKKYCEITVVPSTGRILMKNKVYKGYTGS